MKKFIALAVSALIALTAFGQDYLDSNVPMEQAVKSYLNSRKSSQNIEFETLRIIAKEDSRLTHFRMRPVINGTPVVGAHVTVAVRNGDLRVRRVKDSLKLLDEVATKAGDPLKKLRKELEKQGIDHYTMVSDPAERYVLNRNNKVVKATMVEVEYENADGPQRDQVFVRNSNGRIVARHPQFHYARNRRTYDGNNGSSLPGTLVRNESSGPSGDTCLDAAHDYAGDTYDYFFNVHGRDSLNGSGLTLNSTVHHRSNYNNAFWNGSQMVYGDGDGSTFVCLALDLDVVGHELSHGLTDYTADLIYQNESGALNEATSDIFAAAIEAWAGASTADVWKIGEDIYTPGTAGDALRYMNNPTQDGSSTDYYPTRYTGSADNGGVHWNSGIANLFFYLLSEGGTHPRGVTSNSVSAIGISKAADIWFRALTVYMGPSTTFAQARQDTIDAATDLYGASSNEVTQVGNAWDAVGVVGSGGGGGGDTEITNGQTISGISGSTGVWSYYYIDVPSGATDLAVSISGGSGDADLYLRATNKPTTSTYDCRPWLNGNNESCSVPSPSTTRYYIGIYGYSTFSGVSLTASYTAPSGGSCGNSGSANGISDSTGQWNYYTFNVDACASSLTVTTSGSNGDADLYVRFGANPTTSTFDCRSWSSNSNESCTINNPSAGTYNIGIYAYGGYSGLTLTAEYQ